MSQTAPPLPEHFPSGRGGLEQVAYAICIERAGESASPIDETVLIGAQPLHGLPFCPSWSDGTCDGASIIPLDWARAFPGVRLRPKADISTFLLSASTRHRRGSRHYSLPMEKTGIAGSPGALPCPTRYLSTFVASAQHGEPTAKVRMRLMEEPPGCLLPRPQGPRMCQTAQTTSNRLHEEERFPHCSI